MDNSQLNLPPMLVKTWHTLYSKNDHYLIQRRALEMLQESLGSVDRAETYLKQKGLLA